MAFHLTDIARLSGALQRGGDPVQTQQDVSLEVDTGSAKLPPSLQTRRFLSYLCEP